jgi:hypothetical protein
MENCAYQSQWMAHNPYITATVAATRFRKIQLTGETTDQEDLLIRLGEMRSLLQKEEEQSMFVSNVPSGANIDLRA